MFSLMALQQGLQGKARQENRPLAAAKAQAVLKQAPKWWLRAYFRVFVYDRECQNPPEKNKNQNMLLTLKCLSSSKDTRNKYIKISPLRVVSYSSSSLTKVSPRKSASWHQHKLTLLKRPMPVKAFGPRPECSSVAAVQNRSAQNQIPSNKYQISL